MANKALFLDRDGVINVDHGYVGTIERFEFRDGILSLSRTAVERGYRIVVVTNQAGIARGYYDEAAFRALTAWMGERFVEAGAPLTDVLYCPFHRAGAVGPYARDSFWRKPNPGMILEAARRHAIDVSRSIMIGDQPTDMEAAAAAGVGTRLHLGSEGGVSPVPAATATLETPREALAFLG